MIIRKSLKAMISLILMARAYQLLSHSTGLKLPRMFVSYSEATAMTTKYQNRRMHPNFLFIFQLLAWEAPMRNTTVVSNVRVE